MKHKVIIVGSIILLFIISFLTFQYIFSKPKREKEIFTIKVKENGDIDSCNLNINYDDYKADLRYNSGTNITISIKEKK